MVHDDGDHGYDLHDAKTGTLLLNMNAANATDRGIIGDFSEETSGSEYAVFATDPLRSTKAAATQPDAGYTIGEAVESATGTWAIGSSGSTPSFRIYWDGTLQDEWLDNGIIAHWNDETHGWDRYNVNGTDVTVGSFVGDTKQHPVVMGDILGDWREEVVLYQDNGDGTFSLVINATDKTTDYNVPYLRDDRQYDEAICWQNSGYNQPPHLSFDLYTTYKSFDPIVATVTTNGGQWCSFTPTSNCKVAEGATAYIVVGTRYTEDPTTETSVRAIDCKAVDIMKAGEGYFIRGEEAKKEYNVYTATMSGTPDDVTGNMIVGCLESTTLKANTTNKDYAYILGTQNGKTGLYYVGSTAVTVPAGKAYLQTKDDESDSRFISLDFDAVVTGVSEVPAAVESAQGLMDGKYLLNGKLIIKKNGKTYNALGQQM